MTNIKCLTIPTPFPIGAVNLYLLIGDKITLVDTGPKTELAWRNLIYQLNANGIRIKDIDNVVLTHHHVDHSGLLSILVEHHPDIQILSHEATVPWIERKKEVVNQMIDFYIKLYSEHGLSQEQIDEIKHFHIYYDKYAGSVHVDYYLKDGDYLEGNPEWKVIHNPGHSLGHISLYNEEEYILISGDHLIDQTSSGIFIEPLLNELDKRPKSLVEYKKSLENIKKMQINEVYSGHGDVIYNPNLAVDTELKKISQRLTKVKNNLNSKPLSVMEIVRLVYPYRYHKHLPLYFSEILGALDVLEEQGEILWTRENNIIKYYING